jgi:hypothetical protein
MSDPPQADAPETPVPVPAVPPHNGGEVPGVEVALLCAELAASRRREAWLTAAADVITLMLLAEDPRLATAFANQAGLALALTEARGVGTRLRWRVPV